MPTYCNRHPTQPAWWHCPRCLKSLCPQCISKRVSGQFQENTLYFCPGCNVETREHELSQVIPAFWARLHKFFVYPVSSVQSIGLILVFSLLSTLFSKTGFMALMVHFLIWSLMVKYAFEALKSTAEGRFQPPPLSSQVLLENYGAVFKQIALYFILFVAAFFIAFKAGPAAVLVFGIILGVTLRSILIVLIVNNDLGQALNPVIAIGIIFRIGWSYFLLLFFILLLLSAPAALGYAFIQHMPEKLQLFSFTTAKHYYTLIIYHMMGYVILQYHHRLNYPVELETILASMFPGGVFDTKDDAGHAEKVQHDDLLNEISQLVQDGELEKAIHRIESRVQVDEIKDPVLSERYVGLLKLCKQQDKLLNHAPHHLELLAKSGSKSAALELYHHCLSLDKSFIPGAVTVFKIAGWLSETDNHKEAIFALNSLIKKYPKDALVPKSYYRAAQIFHERLKNGKQARTILNGLLKKFPDHEISAFAKNYLSRL